MLAGCGNSSGSSSSSGAGSTGGDTTSASGTEAGDTGLTAEEQEAVDEGIIQLDGTLPIIKDPAKFEEKYGKISALIVNSADRTVEVGDLAMCQKWFEDTGVEFDWQPIPQESATEKIPHCGCIEQTHNCDDRFRQRNCNFEEESKIAAAVDFCCFEKLDRNTTFKEGAAYDQVVSGHC